jgi:transposase
MKFVSLEPEDRSAIDALMPSKDCNHRTFKRLQSVKLNAQGYSIPQISTLLEVHYNSVYHWITTYEKEGIAGLKDQPISGRPPLLSEADRHQVKHFIRATPQQPKVVLAKVESELGKSISRDTLRRTLKSLDHTYRRVKKSLRSKRNDAAFEGKKKSSKP